MVAFFVPGEFGPIVMGKGGSSNVNAETDTWAAQVVTNGGAAVSSTSQGYVDTLITGIKAHIGPNLNSVLDRLWLFANFDNNNTAALTSVVNPASSIAVSHGSFTSQTLGWQSNGTTGYVDSALNASTAGGNFSLNSASIGFYNLTNRSSAATIGIGAYDGTNTTQLLAYFTSNGNSINTAVGFFPSPGGISDSHGFSMLLRSASNAVKIKAYQSATSADVTDAGVSSAMPNLNFYLHARNNQATADAFTSDKYALMFVGKNLTDGQADNFAADVNTYMTSLGINLY